jgi:putative oxidoreductase
MRDTQSWGIALLRIVTGIVFTVHGAQKLFVFGLAGVTGAFAQMGLPLPGLLAALAIVFEFVGGLALILGLGTRLAALPLAATMAVATFAVHLSHGFFLPQGFEYAFTLLGNSLALSLTGSGALSLDGLLARRASAGAAGPVLVRKSA